MTENVNEQLSRRNQPGADTPQQFFMVAHVFEHLDRHHAIELLINREVIHVGRDHANVVEASLCSLPFNPLTL